MQVKSLVRSLVKSLTPSLSLDQSVSIVSFVERMVTTESFAIRERERREWLRSGRTRTGTTLFMLCLSLVCHCLRERALCVRFQHGEMRDPIAKVVVWRGRSDWSGMAVRPALPREGRSAVGTALPRFLGSLVSEVVMLLVSVPLIMVQMVDTLSLVALSLLDVLHLVINTNLGEVASLSLRGATNHAFLFVVLVLLQ
jgi:hypothetical protein